MHFQTALLESGRKVGSVDLIVVDISDEKSKVIVSVCVSNSESHIVESQ